MKIITPGIIEKIPAIPRWVGLHIRCLKCSCVFQLEESDEIRIVMNRHFGAVPTINGHCPTCDAYFEVKVV